MKKLASFDFKQFREIYDDLKYLKKKTGSSHSKEMSVSNEKNVIK